MTIQCKAVCKTVVLKQISAFGKFQGGRNVSHAVCGAAGNQKYKSSRQGLSRQMLQAQVPAKIPHLPPDQISCATAWKKIAGVGVLAPCGMFGRQETKRSSFHRGITRNIPECSRGGGGEPAQEQLLAAGINIY